MLRGLRQGAGLTQERLGEAIGVTHEYVSRVETGKLSPSWKYILRFAETLRVPVADLLRAVGLVAQPAVDENEIAALVAANPDFEGIILFAREHPERLPEVLDFARYLVRGAPEEQESVTPQPRRRPATADTT